MMLGGWGFTEIANKLLPRPQLSGMEPVLKSVVEPTPVVRAAAAAPARRARHKPALPQPTAREHAQQLLHWVHANIDVSEGPILHTAMLEFYTEMLIETGWAARKWNPVAHQLRLLTTGNRKVYAWIQTTTGTPHRLRTYPIPRAAPAPIAMVATESLRITARARRAA